MNRYFKIYRLIFSLNLSELLAYRAGFFSSFVGSAIWGAFHFISMLLITYRASIFFGWKKEEIFLLTGTFAIMWGTFRLFFVKNFESFSTNITYGKFDGLLLKPIDSQFLLSLWKVSFVEVGRLIMGTAFILYVVHTYRITITPFSVFMYFFLIIFSIISSYSLWFTISTLIIWFPRLDNITELLYGIAGIMRYPPEIVRGLGSSAVFFLAPVLFVIATPTRSLIGKFFAGDIIWLVVFSLAFFAVSRIFWHFALRSYTSVNS